MITSDILCRLLELASRVRAANSVELLFQDTSRFTAASIVIKTQPHVAKGGHTSIIGIFFNYGVDLNKIDKDRETALIVAAYHDSKNIMQLLLEYGADINHANKCGKTALIEAAYYGRKDIVQLLLEHGADSTQTNHAGRTAFDIAVDRGHVEVADFLKASDGGNLC